jgi:hypothetical protein
LKRNCINAQDYPPKPLANDRPATDADKIGAKVGFPPSLAAANIFFETVEAPG